MAPGYWLSLKNPPFELLNNFYEKRIYKTENNFGTWARLTPNPAVNCRAIFSGSYGTMPQIGSCSFRRLGRSKLKALSLPTSL